MAVELHLPDLPDVPLSLGPAAPRRKLPWHLRLRDLLSAYLPLLLMALLAAGTWWLVRHTPVSTPAAPTAEVRREPDYTMSQFAIERFDKTGRLRMRVEGDRLRHYPDTDRYEIDGVRLRAVAPDGQVTRATARSALANSDLSELQLMGGAEVISQPPGRGPVEMRSEFLHAFLVTERVSTHLPVQVREGGSEIQAGGLDYDNGLRRIDLKGPVRARLAPAPARGRG